MEKKSFSEIIEKIKEVYSDVSEFAYNDSYSVKIPEDFEPENKEYKLRETRLDNYLTHIGVGKFREVDQYGGEGQGEDWWTVHYFEDHDIYIRVDGFYQSYNGTEFYDGWDCCKEVRPKEKTITIYE